MQSPHTYQADGNAHGILYYIWHGAGPFDLLLALTAIDICEHIECKCAALGHNAGNLTYSLVHQKLFHALPMVEHKLQLNFRHAIV